MKSGSQTLSHFTRGLFWERGWQGREEVSVGTPLMLFNSKYSSWFFLPSSPHPHLPVSHLWQLLCIHSWNFPDQKRIHHYLHQMQKCQCGWWTYWSLREKRWKEWLQATMQKAVKPKQLIHGNNAQTRLVNDGKGCLWTFSTKSFVNSMMHFFPVLFTNNSNPR